MRSVAPRTRSSAEYPAIGPRNTMMVRFAITTGALWRAVSWANAAKGTSRSSKTDARRFMTTRIITAPAWADMGRWSNARHWEKRRKVMAESHPRGLRMKRRILFWALAIAIVVPAAYFLFVFNWSYSNGERAGWVQKFSSKGWFCKTWEGEMAMVSMPGAVPEKFYFTVWDDAVADALNKVMGKRVSVHYEEKVGLPTSCFGETRHYVIRVTGVDEIPLAPGVVVPAPASPATP